jgi:DNA-binding beta-propeller fold protein YncE
LLVIALAAGVVTAAAAGARLMNDGRDLILGPNTIVRIDPKTNEIVQSIRVGRLPGAIAATAEHVWVVNERDGTVSRVNAETGAAQTIGRFPSVGFLTHDERGNVYASGWDARSSGGSTRAASRSPSGFVCGRVRSASPSAVGRSG